MSADDYFPSIRTFRIPAGLVSGTLRALRDEGRARTESIVFWAGRLVEPDAEIHTLIIPRGPGIELHRDHVRIHISLMVRIAELADPPHSVLLAQVHTHEGSAFHSDVDDVHGFHSPGFLSIVVPRFGRGASTATDWAHFECLGNASVRELRALEVRNRFVVDDLLSLTIKEVVRD
jgi:hypothetical protein